MTIVDFPPHEGETFDCDKISPYPDYEKLIKAWAEDQGYEGFALDYAVVLRNLAAWLNRRLKPC